MGKVCSLSFCRELLAQNINSAIQMQRNDELMQFQNNTFKLIADEYRKTEEFEPSTQRRNNFVWDKLYAAIGDKTITDITPTQILDVCRLYERQGKIDSVKRMRSKASQVFRYAKAFKPAASVFLMARMLLSKLISTRCLNRLFNW